MNEQYSALRSNVSMLGKVLGETIKDALGEHILERVETIRKLSKSSRAGNDANRQELLTTLQNLSNDELLPVARAFSQFLNLRAIPQHFAERRSCQQPGSDRPHPAQTEKPAGTERRHHKKSSGIAVAGTGPHGSPNRNYPSYTDPQNGGSERLLKTAR